jgi:hypothetical protein
MTTSVDDIDILRGVSYDREAARHPVATFGEKRICAQEGCEVVLSRYNDANKCALHFVPRHRTAKAYRPPREGKK